MLSICDSSSALATRAATACCQEGRYNGTLAATLLCLLLLLLLQIHVRGSEVMYFSRRGREHGRLSDYVVFDDVVRHQVRSWRLLLLLLLCCCIA
jgi:hypothetical protein